MQDIIINEGAVICSTEIVIFEATLYQNCGNEVMAASAVEDFSRRDIPMTNSDFTRIQEIAYRHTGILLSTEKKTLVYGRLVRRVRQLNLSCFAEYCNLMERSSKTEKVEFINAITTNVTSFFRESYHFTHLKRDVIPALIDRGKQHKRIRIWSAGCSTGEEPYSIAMVLRTFRVLYDWDVKVFATDLDFKVVEAAKAGVYSTDKARNIPPEYHWMLKFNHGQRTMEVQGDVRDLVSFRPLNLLDNWSLAGAMDLVFCRNVIIYFDAATQQKLFDRFAGILAPDGYLYLGHSESMLGINNRFKPLGQTIYRKLR